MELDLSALDLADKSPDYVQGVMDTIQMIQAALGIAAKTTSAALVPQPHTDWPAKYTVNYHQASQSVAVLELGGRIYNMLRRDGIATIGDLVQTPTDVLMNIRRMGSESVRRIDAALTAKFPGASRGPFAPIEALDLTEETDSFLREENMVYVVKIARYTSGCRYFSGDHEECEDRVLALRDKAKALLAAEIESLRQDDGQDGIQDSTTAP